MKVIMMPRYANLVGAFSGFLALRDSMGVRTANGAEAFLRLIKSGALCMAILEVQRQFI